MEWDKGHEGKIRLIQSAAIESLADKSVGVLYLRTTDAEDEKSEEVVYDFAINVMVAIDLLDVLNEFIAQCPKAMPSTDADPDVGDVRLRRTEKGWFVEIVWGDGRLDVPTKGAGPYRTEAAARKAVEKLFPGGGIVPTVIQ